jgi:hypothetical protein
MEWGLETTRVACRLSPCKPSSAYLEAVCRPGWEVLDERTCRGVQRVRAHRRVAAACAGIQQWLCRVASRCDPGFNTDRRIGSTSVRSSPRILPSNRCRVLLATDAAGEGIDLQTLLPSTGQLRHPLQPELDSSSGSAASTDTGRPATRRCSTSSRSQTRRSSRTTTASWPASLKRWRTLRPISGQ